MHGRMSARTLVPALLLGRQRRSRQADRAVHRGRQRQRGRSGRRAGRADHRGRHLSPESTGDTDAAEVAFIVEDAQQRRGLGSILLEHLAAAAQERGIRRFTAEVLSENTQMVRVFIDAGYSVRREYDSGVIDLVFDIGPTDEVAGRGASREHRAEARSIARLLSPRSIAVIGASAEPTKLGHAVLLNLLRSNFSGPVYPVNPDAVSVQGVRAYRVGDRHSRPGGPGGRDGAGRRRSPRWSSPARPRACTAWW